MRNHHFRSLGCCRVYTLKTKTQMGVVFVVECLLMVSWYTDNPNGYLTFTDSQAWKSTVEI